MGWVNIKNERVFDIVHGYEEAMAELMPLLIIVDQKQNRVNISEHI